jgi:hypothetical protein
VAGQEIRLGAGAAQGKGISDLAGSVQSAMSTRAWAQRSFVVLLLLLSVFPREAHADPIPGKDPPVRGDYETNWGRAKLTYDTGSRQYQLNASLTFADGHLIWGYFQQLESAAPAAWVLVGRWVALPNAQGQLPAAINAGNKCSRRMSHVPTSFNVPGSLHWGSIRLVFASDGKAYSASINYCRENVMTGGTGLRPELRGQYAPLTSAAPATLDVPSLPRDGQCFATSATAVAAIEPCRLEPAKPLTIRLLRDLPKGLTRVTFIPLSDDYRLLAEAVRNNRPLPRHPTARDAYQVVKSNKTMLKGEVANVTPPGAVCGHDYWTVSLKDGTGAVHPSNGVVYMVCGPGTLQDEAPPTVSVAPPVVPRAKK